MKRERSDLEKQLEGLDIAKCLMLLSQSLVAKPITTINSSTDETPFECKTCNRKFSSFQALGGHRASHKKPKLTDTQVKVNGAGNVVTAGKQPHECSMCGQVFGTGQALGGHMRRHRAVVMNDALLAPAPAPVRSPVLKRSGSCKRVVCLDLNLTPLENDLEFIFGKHMAPKIDPKFII